MSAEGARVAAGDRDRRIAAMLVGGAAVLMLEVRFEHREVLGEEAASWIPLLYCGLTLAAGAIALRRWDLWGRRALAAVFLLGAVVGCLGFWFHSGGHPLRAIVELLGAWRMAPGGMKTGSRPPPLAPLAFCGIGALGWLVTARGEPRR